MRIRILHFEHEVYCGFLRSPTELGRQRDGEPAPFQTVASGGRLRLIIAPLEDASVSRSTLLIEPLPDNRVRLVNLSSTLTLNVDEDVRRRVSIAPGQEFVDTLPARIRLETCQIELAAEHEFHDVQEDGVRQLPVPTTLPSYNESMEHLAQARHTLGRESANWDFVIEWLRSAMSVLQISADSDQLFQTAVEAAAGLVGLDSSRVLAYREGRWHVCTAAAARETADAAWKASMSVLDRVRNEQRTFWKSNVDLGQYAPSLAGVTSVVAAPILNRSGDVIAVLYGDRRYKATLSFGGGLTELDATLMELLACGIAAGLARVEQERAALEARTRFEEFFTPRLSQRLIDDPSLLTGQERNVTIMFCDVRRFSRITERLGPHITVRLLNDVMGELSEAVLQRNGVLVDYSGDALMAMWGAPEDQPDHPRLACEAALSILEALPVLNERWSSHLSEERIDVSIGINTGPAYVGNVGSHRKFKYGALGNTVNQASRIQGATKYFGARVLLSSKTLDGLAPDLIQHQTRRAGRVKVLNIEELVSLHELVPASEPNFSDRKSLLESFEELLTQNQIERAREVLQKLLAKYPHDGAAQAYRAQLDDQELLSKPDMQQDGLWRLRGK